MVHLVRLFWKTHLLALLQDNSFDLVLGSLCFLAQVGYMRGEYNSVLSTPTEADKIGRFGRYRYTGKPIYRSISNSVKWTKTGPVKSG